MSDHPYCKTCECYRLDRFADGTISAFCEYRETCIDVNSRPLFDDGLCYERATRAKLPPEERHRRLSDAGRKGGLKGRIHPPRAKLSPEERHRHLSEAGRKGGLKSRIKARKTGTVRVYVEDRVKFLSLTLQSGVSAPDMFERMLQYCTKGVSSAVAKV